MKKLLSCIVLFQILSISLVIEPVAPGKPESLEQAYSYLAASALLQSPVEALDFFDRANQYGIDFNSQEALHALLTAIRKGNSVIVDRLISNGVDVNRFTKDRTTSPLLTAVSFGEHDIAQLLLDSGANPNIRSIKNWTPLTMAEHRNDENMRSLLLANGAKE